MFFGGTFSHAVRKQSHSGEFRVQERLGGVISPAVAPARLIRHARGLLEASARSWPSLFLEHAPGAAKAFATAVRRIT